jgi:hypothetical protein
MQIARRLVEGTPDVDAIRRAALNAGLILEVQEPEPLEVWSEHAMAASLIGAMSTQINVGSAGGILGYRYESLPVVYRALGGKRKRWPQVFNDFRTLEAEVVRLVRERAD